MLRAFATSLRMKVLIEASIIGLTIGRSLARGGIDFVYKDIEVSPTGYAWYNDFLAVNARAKRS